MEMAYCSEKGIPHSKFLSWSQEDRAKQHAYLMEEATRCALCGTQPWEWEANKRAYMAVDKFCHGCYVKHAASEDNDSLPGTTVDLVPYSAEQVARQAERFEAAQKARREARRRD